MQYWVCNQRERCLLSGTPPPVKHDCAWHGSITNADWCPFARLFTFIYLSVYLRQVYLLMGLKDMMANLHLLVWGRKKGKAIRMCNIYTWMNKRRREDGVHLFYLDSSSRNSYSFLVMEKWYGPFSYLALIPIGFSRFSIFSSLLSLCLSSFVLLTSIWLVSDGRIWVGSNYSLACMSFPKMHQHSQPH